ncbi:MAG: biotin-dependent carboxyltransferase family protein [Hyphomonadaceae bacterium]|nr:biotin-dependent carboxyltransferase family protein [Hyphomonadaceae bacterium]
MKPALRILAPGLMTTLQDLGRPGHQRLGIPVSGALDAVSLRAANLLVGNPPGAGALEIVYQGPAFVVEAESVRVAFAGGSAPIDVLADETAPAGQRSPGLQSLLLSRGQVLRIGALSASAVGYLAVEGGFDVPAALGSQSTFARAALGGFAGRALRAGDLLPLRQAQAEPREERMLPSLEVAPPRRFRVVFGPQDDYFSAAGKRTLQEGVFTVSPASDRMGMRLEGPALEHAKGYNIVSDGIAPGSIQVPGNGLPIVLLADRQTTGGYPKIATVISADLPALGRLAPGAKVAFEAVGVEAAEAAHRQLRADIDAIAQRIVGVRAAIDEAKLLRANLVSGMVDAHDWRPDGY